MDQANRFVIVTLALGLTFLALVAIILAWGAPGGTIDRINDLASWLSRHNDRQTKVIITLAAVVVVLLALTAMLVELTPPASQRMRVRNVGSGDARISTPQIAARINDEVAALPDIAACSAVVIARGKRVEVVLDLHVEAGAELARTAGEACACAQRTVEQQLGIELAQKPRARLHYRELRLQRPQGAVAPPPRASTGWERPGSEGEDEQHA